MKLRDAGSVENPSKTTRPAPKATCWPASNHLFTFEPAAEQEIRCTAFLDPHVGYVVEVLDDLPPYAALRRSRSTALESSRRCREAPTSCRATI